MNYLLCIILTIFGSSTFAPHNHRKEKVSEKMHKNVFAIVEYTNLVAGNKPPTVRKLKFTSEKNIPSPQVVIEVQDKKPGQLMDGIGGAFNEQGWIALSALPAGKRRKALQNLFNTKKGANLCFNRIPIGASDFAMSAYSLDNTKDDWALKHFSVKRDERCLIPYIKAAQSINPKMKFHASAWSPPGWMKTNGSQTGGGELLGDNRTLASYAGYFVKFLQAYQQHGIMIQRLCPQNEPLVAGSYPGCKIPAPLYEKALEQWVIPAIKRSGLKTEVWAGTFNFWRQDTRKYFDYILNDTGLTKEAGGFSFQYSNMDWIRKFVSKYPHVKLQHSESECYYGANSVEQAFRDFQDFVAYVRAGCSLFTFWNMVLPEPHTSTWGWKQNSLVVIDTAKRTVTYEPGFALAYFLGRHLLPGSRYLPAMITEGQSSVGALGFAPKGCVKFMHTFLNNGNQVVAFREPNGSLVVYLLNQGEKMDAEIKCSRGTVAVVLPAKALVSIVIKG